MVLPDWLTDARATLPRQGDYPLRPLGGVTGAVVHYSAVAPEFDAVFVANYHVNANDWPKIGYHFYVEADAKAVWCNDLNRASYHATIRNETHIGVCYAGNVRPTPDQLVALARCIWWSGKQLGRRLTIEGHRDGYATACPGAAWPEWRGELAATVEHLWNTDDRPDVSGGHSVHPRLLDYLRQHPEVGIARGPSVWTTMPGNSQVSAVVECVPTPRHPQGCEVVYRRSLDKPGRTPFRVVSWE